MGNRFDPALHKYYINEIEVPHITGLLPKQEKYVSDEKYEAARKRGEDNHSMIKLFLDTGDIYNDPMLFALDIMLKDHPEFGKVILYEQPLFSKRYMFGGKPDVIFENAKIDFKLNFNNKYYHSLQLAAQEILTMENNISPDTENWFIAYYQNSKFKLKPVYNPEAKKMFLKLVDKYYIDQSINKFLKGEIDG
ncbi:MAG: hypothetical protein A2Y62_21210 [Candidatus Fischerbacteria bacterium RBG_13_37_8]|uniref:Uncharacterized protein n=1 Tax=Candidatus Fischerbacteria bacterium RBG_13_37_8 TaxID=1817863 RepID=A0A1F5V4Y1_9BACT|nr:MAG: hypothetical protein A2Y62_21210 [Candidatus Fischerbacteria bacterium RBG_13_37_8]